MITYANVQLICHIIRGRYVIYYLNFDKSKFKKWNVKFLLDLLISLKSLKTTENSTTHIYGMTLEDIREFLPTKCWFFYYPHSQRSQQMYKLACKIGLRDFMLLCTYDKSPQKVRFTFLADYTSTAFIRI